MGPAGQSWNHKEQNSPVCLQELESGFFTRAQAADALLLNFLDPKQRIQLKYFVPGLLIYWNHMINLNFFNDKFELF